MDTHEDSTNIIYDKFMPHTVGESSEFENEIREHIKHERLSDDGNQIDVSTQETVINTTEYQPISFNYLLVQNTATNTETESKSLNEWSKSLNEWNNENINEKVQPMTNDATFEAGVDNSRAVGDVSTIFPFVCGICDEKFKSISIYLKHVSLHEKMNSYLLQCCSQDDAVTEEKITLFTCGICSIKFPSLCTLYKHLKESENVYDFVFKSSERTVYAYHEKITENLRVTKNVAHTSRTRKRTSYLDEIYYHLNHKTYVGASTKEASKTPFASNDDDDVEGDVEMEEDVDYCIEDDVEMIDDCYTDGVDDDNDDTTRKQKRKVDTMIHNDMKVPCDQCDKVYSKSSLYFHKKQVHAEEKKYICDQCGKSFKAGAYLWRHRQIHAKESIFQCPDCPMKFKVAAGLRSHRKTHSDQRPYCCEVCGLKFKRTNFLTNHKKYHSEEKPFACPECGKTFKVKNDMKKHFRIHLPPEFFCLICGKSFVQKSSLRIHMKVHEEKL